MIELIDITKKYGNGTNAVLAVQDVNIVLTAGKKYALTGPSGCGKTTLIKLIGLIILPTSGKVIIDGCAKEDVEKRANQIRNKRFGYVSQDFLLVKGLSAYKNIEIPLLYSKPKLNRKERDIAIRSAAEKCNALHLINRKTEEMSGGEQQRIAIARALVNDPDIILADEPTGSLDSKNSDDITRLLLSLDKTLVIATHNMEIASQADRIIKMLDGRIEDVV